MSLHDLLDTNYGSDGAAALLARLEGEQKCDQEERVAGEPDLHVAARRQRLEAVQILLEHGLAVDARNGHGKSAYVHALRRSLNEVAELLIAVRCESGLELPDQLAVRTSRGETEEARSLLERNPAIAKTGNPEEDRLLADMAGRADQGPVQIPIDAGANLAAPGLDDATPLHNAAWFAQAQNARLLVEAGAPLNLFEMAHGTSPIGWAAHGSSCSGGAEANHVVYVEITQLLLEAGAYLHYPGAPGDGAYLARLQAEASPQVEGVLTEWMKR
ncbi:MAG: ankyrin repeat protein [Candidatus Paceibacteria bacterium]|jgi:ankyrin repeat protein